MSDPTRFQPGMCMACEESPATSTIYDEHNGPVHLCDACRLGDVLCSYCGTFGHEAATCDERELTDWSDDVCGTIATVGRWIDPVCREAKGHTGTHVAIHADGTRTGFWEGK